MNRSNLLTAFSFLLAIASAHCSSAAVDEPARDADVGAPVTNPQPTPTPSSTATAPPPLPPAPVSVFMATGHMGRTVTSCDDGKTWIKDRSDDDATRCWVTGDPNYKECDHTPFSGGGIDAGDGWFFADYGWGYNGSVKRSRDGANWEIVKTGGWGGGTAYASKTLMNMWGKWSYSTDQGKTWNEVSPSPADQLDYAKIYRVGTKFFATSRSSGVMLSRDQGRTWDKPAGVPSEWAQAVAEGTGVLVTIGVRHGANGANNVGIAARSTDDGRTWTSTTVFDEPSREWDTNLIFDGAAFVAYSGGRVLRSTDGASWTPTPTKSAAGAAFSIAGPVAHNPLTKTYVSISSQWGNFYEKQRAYRSIDGVTWTELTAAQFKGGHPLSRIIVGEMGAAFCK